MVGNSKKLCLTVSVRMTPMAMVFIQIEVHAVIVAHPLHHQALGSQM